MIQTVLTNITEIINVIENIEIGDSTEGTIMETNIFIETLTTILIKIDLNLYDEEFFDLIYQISSITNIESISIQEQEVLDLIGKNLLSYNMKCITLFELPIFLS